MSALGKTKPDARFVLSAHALSQVPRDRKPQISFGGRSNVGKSTLINTLLSQKKLAKTSSTPGRTQALNFFEIDRRLYFVDLPGYGFARAPVQAKENWGRLTDEYLTACDHLAGMVLLLDCRREPNQDDRDLYGWLQEAEIPFVVALTKVDKLARGKALSAQRKLEAELGTSVIPFSSVSGAGRRELWGWINQTAFGS